MDKPRQLSIDSFRGKNRVLVLFSPNATDPHRLDQMAMLDGLTVELADRDIVVLEVLEKGVAMLDGVPIRLLGTSDLRVRFECRKGEFRVVLVSKDGRTAQSFDHPVAMGKVFDLIDSSPLRKQELRKRPPGEPYAG